MRNTKSGCRTIAVSRPQRLAQEENQNWLLNPCRASVPNTQCKEEIRSGCITPTNPLLGVPSAQRKEEIKTGYITPAALGVQMWAKWLHNLAVLGLNCSCVFFLLR